MGLSRRRFLRATLGFGAAAALNGTNLLAYRGESERENKLEAICHYDFTRKALGLHHSQNSDFNNQKLITQIIKGSIEEDNPITNCVQHYYNPDQTQGKQGLIFPVLNDGSKNALTRAEELWQQALEFHQQEKYPEAYYTLGRVCHLLEDMASPEHVYLVNHAIIKIVTKDGSMLNEEFLKKLGQHLNIDQIDLTKSTYQIGSTFEKNCSKISLEEVLGNQKIEVVEKDSLKELFDGLAHESLDSKISPLIQKHLQINSQGNGTYVNSTFTLEETKEIASYLAPKTVGHIAGLLKLWEKEIYKKPKKIEKPVVLIGIIDQTLKERLYLLDKNALRQTPIVVNQGNRFTVSLDHSCLLYCDHNYDKEHTTSISKLNWDGGIEPLIENKKAYLSFSEQNSTRKEYLLYFNQSDTEPNGFYVLNILTKETKFLKENNDSGNILSSGFINDSEIALYNLSKKQMVIYNLLNNQEKIVNDFEQEENIKKMLMQNGPNDYWEIIKKGRCGFKKDEQLGTEFVDKNKIYFLSQTNENGKTYLKVSTMENLTDNQKEILVVEIDSKQFNVNQIKRGVLNLFGVLE